MREDRIEKARELMDEVLTLLREERDSLNRGPGARELSEATTNFETGCMWMVRSQFADEPYSPLTKPEKVKD